MVARKSHAKSRNGCAQCKRRRIKCDELRPVCSNCSKHEVECAWALSTSVAEHDRKTTLGKRPRSRDREDTTGQIKQAAVPNRQQLWNSEIAAPGLGQLQMLELELLHHFTTETFLSLSDRKESHEIWRVTVPQLAFKHAFLMRGIMAISSLHLSRLRPNQYTFYYQTAIRMQNSALASFRGIMPNMDADNCDASFAMSTLIVVYGFQSRSSTDRLSMFNHSNDQTDEWLPFIRGVNVILQNLWIHVKQGRLHRLLHDHVPAAVPDSGGKVKVLVLPSPLDEDLRRIEDEIVILLEIEAVPDQIASGDEINTSTAGQERYGKHDVGYHLTDQQAQDVQACREAVYHLRECFMRVVHKRVDECEVSLAFLWPVMVPDRFLELLSMHSPAALIILAYYSVILHHLDHYWWLMDWGQHIIFSIQKELSVDLLGWIEWPLRMVTPITPVPLSSEQPGQWSTPHDRAHSSHAESVKTPVESSERAAAPYKSPQVETKLEIMRDESVGLVDRPAQGKDYEKGYSSTNTLLSKSTAGLVPERSLTYP